MNAGVILAAGRGTRMGFPKQLALYKGKTLIEQVNKFVNSYFQKSIVVLGYESELIIDSTDFSNSEILLNENWEEGIISSLRTAIMYLENLKDIENLFLFLTDQPAIKPKVVEKLISLSEGSRQVIVPQYRYRVGYPICIPKNYWNKVSLLDLTTKNNESNNFEFNESRNELDPLSIIEVSDIEVKKVWFKYLQPLDINEERDR
tara:strand:- start:401 stop:1012 length:612 start_codon:yes stop_codon:yes gene_type:complete